VTETPEVISITQEELVIEPPVHHVESPVQTPSAPVPPTSPAPEITESDIPDTLPPGNSDSDSDSDQNTDEGQGDTGGGSEDPKDSGGTDEESEESEGNPAETSPEPDDSVGSETPVQETDEPVSSDTPTGNED
jgi:hypothetical protein